MIPSGHVTGISQYAWTNPDSDFSRMTDDELHRVVTEVDKFHQTQVKMSLLKLNFFGLLDTAILGESTRHFLLCDGCGDY